MRSIINRFFKFCPKTGKFRGLREQKGFYKLLFPFIGFIALLWILVRVIPKPSRLSYPCVKTAMPLAAGFIGNIILLTASAIAFIRLRKSYFRYQFAAAALFTTLGIGGTFYYENVKEDIPLLPTFQVEENEPMGVAQGILPGRVVWVYNPDATNENCTLSQNRDGVTDNNDDGWFLEKNNNQVVIDKMLSDGLKSLTGKTTDAEAWDAIFKFHNNKRGKGAVGYVSGEKIFIKINATSSWSGNYVESDLSKTDSRNNQYFQISETSPQMILATLKQLVNVAGVAQSDIYVGDPMKHIYKHIYDILEPVFPDVHYMDNSRSDLGREKFIASTTAEIEYSDRGAQLRAGDFSDAYNGVPVISDNLYKIFEDAEYMINIPMMKGHKRNGTTMFAKNHFGSQTRGSAVHMHCGTVAPNEMQNGVSEGGYGKYRILVDLMSHKLLGEKNLVYIMDALWSSDHELGTPRKFYMAPFNHDWTSSIFVSLDVVAIESVGYDFLRTEFTSSRNNDDGANTYVQMDGVDDYLHQAADKANWPAGITYDPENDGIEIASLGTHEHWNNAIDKQYSRNLGTGTGIELVQINNVTSVNDKNTTVNTFELFQNYPNPFNPSTMISYQLAANSDVKLRVYDVLGNEIAELVNTRQTAGRYDVHFNASSVTNGLTSGIYIYKLNVKSDFGKSFEKSAKMILMK